MFPVQDGYTEFLLQTEICLRIILLSVFWSSFSLNKVALTETSETAR